VLTRIYILKHDAFLPEHVIPPLPVEVVLYAVHLSPVVDERMHCPSLCRVNHHGQINIVLLHCVILQDVPQLSITCVAGRDSFVMACNNAGRRVVQQLILRFSKPLEQI
jgi:hypothetical protein